MVQFRTDPTYLHNLSINAESSMDLNKIDIQLIPDIRSYFKSNLNRKIRYNFLFNRYIEVTNGEWMSEFMYR